MKYFLAFDLPGPSNKIVKTAKTSSPKSNDRSPERQQVKYKHILNSFQVKEHPFFRAKELQCQQSASARNQNPSSFKQSHVIITSNLDCGYSIRRL